MRIPIRAAFLTAALLLAPAAHAQPQPAPPPPPEAGADSGIVITGSRDRERQVRDFVGALTPAPSGAIPRFIDQVCPVVVGLIPAQAEAVANRLRTVAEAAGLPVAGRGCAPNAFVIVTRDKRAFIEALSSRRPESFGMMSIGQVRRLARAPGPAAAWHLEGPVDENGVPLPFDANLGAYVNESAGGVSRLRAQGGRGFDASALVVETRALAGLTAVQLADYAAMRLFARLDPARLPPTAPPTILTALTAPMGTPVPVTLTSSDFGLLRGLYLAPANLAPASQRSDIRRRMLREGEAQTPEPQD